MSSAGSIKLLTGVIILTKFEKHFCKKSIMSKYQEEQDQELGKQAIRLANAVVLPMVIKSALELNVIDIIFASGEGSFLSPSEVASRLPTKNPDAPVILDRMLRLLASYDILKCSVRAKDNGRVNRLYTAGPICKFLVKNEHGRSLGSWNNDKVFIENWYHLNNVVLEGGIPFNKAHEMTLYEYTGTDKRFNRLFNQAMSNLSTLIMEKVLDVYKGFEGLNKLVDVGGGIGFTINMIISKYPHIEGINFDLPHVITDAPPYSGVEHVGGDMFVSVPKGDAIFMNGIFHGWSDEHCLKLLKNCYEALPNSGKVIIVETILPVTPENNVTSQIVFEDDLWMLALCTGGKKRTHKDFEALAVKSGFSGCEVICCAYNNWVMEFYKRAS